MQGTCLHLLTQTLEVCLLSPNSGVSKRLAMVCPPVFFFFNEASLDTSMFIHLYCLRLLSPYTIRIEQLCGDRHHIAQKSKILTIMLIKKRLQALDLISLQQPNWKHFLWKHLHCEPSNISIWKGWYCLKVVSLLS